MADVRIPSLGESVNEGTIVQWLKQDGDRVRPDDPVLELETDKATMELPAGAAGVLRILKQRGETVSVGDVVARIEDGGGAAARPATPDAKRDGSAPPAEPNPEAASEQDTIEPPSTATGPLSPAVRKLVTENRLDPATIPASGKGGRLTKEDVLAHLARMKDQPGAPTAETARAAEPAARAPEPAPRPTPAPEPAARAAERAPRPAPAPSGPSAREGEERVPMSPIRKRIAERLVQAQRTAAILTTFNEIDMTAVMELRARMKERFQKAHGVGLGFMSFFSRASIAALRDFPMVNAEIRGDDIVYKHYVNLGIAVGTERGLVVPIIHHAERLSFAEIEREIERLAGRAREGKLSIDELSGGTFTISNGGVYGSLMSTPILNPPQSGILGLHKIEKRPVAVDDQIVIRPMMYVALSYDHRLVDGEQAVSFLVRVKERVEDPTRLMLDV